MLWSKEENEAKEATLLVLKRLHCEKTNDTGSKRKQYIRKLTYEFNNNWRI